MDAVGERDVRVGVAKNVEGVRVVEHLLVEVRGAVEHHNPLTRLDLDSGQFRVHQRGALKGGDWPSPADDLIGRGRRTLSLVQIPLIRVVGEGDHPVGDGVAGGLAAGDGERREQRRAHARRNHLAQRLEAGGAEVSVGVDGGFTPTAHGECLVAQAVAVGEQEQPLPPQVDVAHCLGAGKRMIPRAGKIERLVEQRQTFEVGIKNRGCQQGGIDLMLTQALQQGVGEFFR